jgi:FixJ family two-component response regulator
MASQREIAMPVPRERTPPAPSRGEIWIVDDDEWVADSLKSLLETIGYDVQSYNSGADFLADDRRGASGCLIIDQHMSGMDGLEVVDCLQKRGAPVPVILISGRLDTHIKERAASLGVTSVLEKPFAANLLIDLIQTVPWGRS